MMASQLISAMNTRLLRVMIQAQTVLRPQHRGATTSSAALGFTGAMAYAAIAHAQTISGISSGEGPTAMLQQICNFILGGFGQTLAVLGIIGIGLAWMFGRVSLGLIAGVVGGIVIMFGASYLGSTLTSASTSGGGSTQ